MKHWRRSLVYRVMDFMLALPKRFRRLVPIHFLARWAKRAGDPIYGIGFVDPSRPRERRGT